MKPVHLRRRAALTASALSLTTVMISGAAWAQTPQYFVSQSTVPYVNMVGGNQLNLQFDAFQMVPLGFTFNYFGVDYDTAVISENGFIQLAADCSQGSGCDPFGNERCNASFRCEPFGLWGGGNLGDSFFPNRVIAPMWGDYRQDQVAVPASQVKYTTNGIAPNREFVVEWRDTRWETWCGGTQSRFSFQLKLSEASGQVKFHYGAWVAANDASCWSTTGGIEDEFGSAVFGPACSNGPGVRCTSTNFGTLTNKLITIGPPNSAELTAVVRPLGGGAPGQPVSIAVDVQNLGLQPASVPFLVNVYLALASPIIPGRDPLLGGLVFNNLAAQSTATATLTGAIPLGTGQGYYLGAAVVDFNNTIFEATEQNNVVYSVEPVLVGNDVQPVITDFVPIAAGTSGPITFEMQNLSTAVGSTQWAVFLSLDSTLDGSDSQLASGTVNLPTGARVSVTTEVAIPAQQPGYLQLLVVADPNNTLTELDEFNNVAPTEPFPIGPELSVESVQVPGTSGAGEPTAFDFFLSNIGASVPGVEYEIYLSQDQVLSGGDPLVGSGVVPAIGGQTTMVTATATIPPPTMRGDYYLIVVLDPNNNVDEIDEGNNTGASSSSFEIIGADLAGSNLSGDIRAYRGDPYTVEATISNVGGQTIHNFRYSFYLSLNRLITYTDPLLFQSQPTTLVPGQRINVRHTPVISSTIAAGNYYLGLIVDSDGIVQEDQELNNTKISRETIEVRDRAPDFVVTEVRVAELAAAGEPLTIQRSLENAGNAPGSSPYTVYLTPENGIDAKVEIGTGQVTLAVGQVDDGIDEVLIPVDAPVGRYVVEYVMDPAQIVPEIIDDNNSGRSDQVLDLAPPQLQIYTKFIAPVVVAASYSFQLTAGGSLGALTWSLSSGALPAGLSLAPSTGLITGVVSEESQTQVVVRVTDGVQTAERPFTVTAVFQPLELEVATRALPPAFAGRPYEYALTAFGGIPPYRWVSEELPVGFTFTSSGTLVGASSVGGFSRAISFEVQDAIGSVASRPITLRILDADDGLRFGTTPLADGLVGRAYNEMLTALGGVEPYTFSLLDGALPPGLTLDGATVQGEPTKAGLYIVTLGVTDGRNDFDQNVFVIGIEPAEDAVRFLTTGLPFGKVGVDYKDESARPIQLRALPSSAGTAVAFATIGGAVPAGLTLSGDGTISGSPSTAGTFGFLIKGEDESGRSDVRAFGIVVEPADPTVVDPGTTDDGCGCTTTHQTHGAGLGLGMLMIGLFVARRRRILPFVCALVVSASTSASAQPVAANYILFEEEETYVERTGGTPIGFDSFDDGQAIVNLPFSFRFYENDYSSLHIGTNGWISFTSDAWSLSNLLFPDPSAGLNNIIALFWDDLLQPNGTTQVEGTSPNQIFIIQWKDTQRYPGSAPEMLNMQLWLYEGGAGRFEIHYGPTTFASFPMDASVGMQDDTGMRGENLMACTPRCGAPDLIAYADRKIVATQDAGEDVVAIGLSPLVRGLGRVYQGVPFQTQIQVASYHGDPLGPFQYQIYLFQGTTPTFTNPIYTSTTVTLTPYQSLSETIDVAVPLGQAEGRYRLAMVVDAFDAIAEPEESNNTVVATQELLLGQRHADFTATRINLPPGTVAPGAAITVPITLANQGNLDGASTWTLVLSSNPSPSIGDLVLASGNETLPLLTEVTVSPQATIPVSVPAGQYTLGVILDAANQTPELDEVNNIFVGPALDVVGPNIVVVGTLPAGYVGVDYTGRLLAQGGNGSYTFSIDSGRLPDGLTLLEDGQLIGRPTDPDEATFELGIRSGTQSTVAGPFTVIVAELDGPLAIITRDLVPGIAGQPYPPTLPGEPAEARQRLVAVGANAESATFTLIGGAPMGLGLDPDGYLHGVPAAAGRFDLEVSVSDGTTTSSRRIPLWVVDSGRLTLVPTDLPDAVVGESFDYSFVVIGQTVSATVGFSTPDANPPDGLSVTLDGKLTGIPSKVGTFRFRVRVAEGGNLARSDSTEFVLDVASTPEFAITPSTVPDAIVGTPYEVTFEARLGTPPYRWTAETNFLPRGLTTEVVTGTEERMRLKGTPESVPEGMGVATGGIAALTVKVEDALGRTAEIPLAIRVIEPAAPPPPMEDSGCSCRASATRTGNPQFGLVLLALGIAGLRRRTKERR